MPQAAGKYAFGEFLIMQWNRNLLKNFEGGGERGKFWSFWHGIVSLFVRLL